MSGPDIPAPVVRPVAIDQTVIDHNKAEAARDAARSQKDVAASAKRRQNLSSQTRATGFSGSGVYIPGGGS